MTDDAFLEFLVESQENLDLFDRKMIELESAPENRQILNEIFRAVHTIKGTASFFGLGAIESLGHAGENVLGALRDGKFLLTPQLTTTLLEMGDTLRQMMTNVHHLGNEGELNFSLLLQRLKGFLEGKTKGEELQGAPVMERKQPFVPALAPSTPAFIPALAPRTPTRPKLTPVISKAFALETPAPPPPPQPEAKQKNTEHNTAFFTSGHEKVDTDSSVRVDVSLLGKLMDLVGELVLTRNQVLQYTSLQQDPSFVRVVQRLNLITSELQEGLTKTRMQNIGSMWRKLPRVIRDLSVACGKRVELVMEGKETEIDKTVLEAIKDPLTHLIRNSIDHGIEMPEVRAAAGKPPDGKILLRAFHESGKVNIEIVDDGGGIRLDKVKQKAIEKQLITVEQAAKMPEKEALDLIFLPGFSTAEKVTNISGRGVGMDVVKTNIEKIGGSIDVQSTQGQGSKFQIRIPLTLAIVPALLVTADNCRYAIPQTHLIELVRISDAETRGIEYLHAMPVYRLRDRLLPIIFLNQVLGVPMSESKQINIVVLHAEHGHFGLVVDKINDTSEIVVKPLAKQLKCLPVYAGATIMGDGRVSLILDVAYLASLPKLKPSKLSVKQTTEKQSETRSFLLFTSGGARLAAPLHEITRIEWVAPQSFERSSGGEVIQYRGEILRLVRLNQLLHLPHEEEENSLPVLVVNTKGGPVGVIIREVLDVVEGVFPLKKSIPGAGLAGSILIHEKVTDLVDMQAALAPFHQEQLHE